MREALDAMAAREERPIGQMARLLLREALAARGVAVTPPRKARLPAEAPASPE
jgi:hypothetical protein